VACTDESGHKYRDGSLRQIGQAQQDTAAADDRKKEPVPGQGCDGAARPTNRPVPQRLRVQQVGRYEVDTLGFLIRGRRRLPQNTRHKQR
jgi:hypothetical protein